MILSALLRAIPFAFHRAARGVLLRSLLVTLAIFALLGIGLWRGLIWAFAWIGWETGGLAEAGASVVILILAGWLLFRVVAMAVMGLFADAVVEAVERDTYPAAAATARPVGLGRSTALALRSVGRALALNLLALPFYVALLVTGVGTIGLVLLVNGWLLGRDLADMVEPRHPDMPPVGRGDRWTMGLLSALLFLLPVVNLLAPIWSAAMAVHVRHGRTRTERARD